MDSLIDGVERRILRLLQNDGRLTNAELAKKVNVSPATCHRRTQRLFSEGYVRAVRAEVAPERVARGTLVMVGVVLDRSTPESFAELTAAPDYDHRTTDTLMRSLTVDAVADAATSLVGRESLVAS